MVLSAPAIPSPITLAIPMVAPSVFAKYSGIKPRNITRKPMRHIVMRCSFFATKVHINIPTTATPSTVARTMVVSVPPRPSVYFT